MTNLYKKGDSDTRPWGTWEVLESSPNHCVKRICVKPEGKLSLQYHNYRAEKWSIVKGTAQVTLDDKNILLHASESVTIPVKTKHRIENIGDEDLVFIEIQTGKILDEKDIVRLQDIYGRTRE